MWVAIIDDRDRLPEAFGPFDHEDEAKLFIARWIAEREDADNPPASDTRFAPLLVQRPLL